MKTKNQKMLPKTAEAMANGGIYSQRVRCGKSNCKCSRGETHSAFYFFTRRNGKLVKFYIRKAEYQQFSSLVDRITLERKEQRRIAKENLELLKEFREVLREKQSFINSLN
jgi:Family of unknown function (DUF6788)